MAWLWESLAGGAGYVLHLLLTKLTNARFGSAMAFFAVVCVVDLVTGRRIVNWTRGMAHSTGASVVVYVINLIVYPILLSSSRGLERGYERLHIPHVPTSTWEGMPIWLVAVLGIVVHDFANYWNHRAMHLRWIWPIHAVHHSDPEVTAMTTFRVHAFEGIFMWASYVILLTWLGLPPSAIEIGGIVLLLHNQYVHVNVDWDHGPFKWFLASPRFHRWHHVNDPKTYGKNLANLFPIFDRVFGTYYAGGPCRGPMGATGVPENDVVKLMIFPLSEWARMIARAVRGDRQR